MLMNLWQRLKKFGQKIRSQYSTDPLERCRWIRFPSTLESRSERQKDRLARAGEAAAADYLESKGYTILHRNLRFPEGELDIIAKWKNTLVFVEVKTRQTEKYGQPFSAVSEKKQRRQVVMASKFQSICRLRKVPVRFDVVSIVLPTGQVPAIEHLENAFQIRDI